MTSSTHGSVVTQGQRDRVLAERRELVHRVAQHYASLGWAVTPGFHECDGGGRPVCSKHPSVGWKEIDVAAGRVIGATTDPLAIQNYWLGPGSDPVGADICIHAKPSHLVVVDCDRSWKPIVIEGEDGKRAVEERFVDGLAAFLDFMGGDVGTELVSVSKRGVHFFYWVDSDLAAKIRNRAGWLPGVDVRGGGESSGGVTIETNGVCPHRRWVRGTPGIEVTEGALEGVIAGLEPYPSIRFDEAGVCTGGLPMMVGGRVEGVRRIPPKLLRALLVSSGVLEASDADVRDRRRQVVRQRVATSRSRDTDPQAGTHVDARVGASKRPHALTAQCACGRCKHFSEARDLLAWIPPEVDYEAWRNVIWGLSDALGGARCGEELAAEWSDLSIIERRRNSERARQIYRSDNRHLERLLR